MLDIHVINSIYGAEKTLAILIIRIFFKNASTEEANEFINNNNIKWNLFYNIIKGHSIRPVVYYTSLQNQIKIDPSIVEILKEDISHITIRRFQQLKKTIEIYETLKGKDIDVIPYKGINFCLGYYPSIEFRESVDLDFLVDSKDVLEIKKTFESKGYECYTDVPDSYLNYLFKFAKDLCFFSKRDDLGFRFSIEIHWKLLEPSNGKFVSFYYLKNNLSKRKLGIHEIPELNETSNFLAYYSHHCIQDPLFKLKYLIDLGLMVQNTNRNINWSEVNKVLIEFKQEKNFSACINTLSDIVGINFDNFSLKQTNHKILIDNVLEYPITKHYSKQYFKLFFTFKNNLIEKIKTLTRFVFYALLPTPGDIITFKLPFWAFPILCILRPFRIIYKFLLK
jgi:hypothetical protein